MNGDLTLIDHLTKFPDEQACRDFVQSHRWPDETWSKVSWVGELESARYEVIVRNLC